MKIAVLVSGGVDSAVALALLQQQGHEVVPYYLKIWLEDELAFLGECPWEVDLSHARAVCEKLGLELIIVSLQQAYKEKIIGYTIDEIKAGRTPNPDMLCNTYIKFGTFLDQYGAGFDKVATGHYAGIIERPSSLSSTLKLGRTGTLRRTVLRLKEGKYFLQRTPDDIKDQTYFLARLSQEQLARTLFPLADVTKQQVRQLAEQFDLPNKDRKDSQGLCFLGKIKFADFIKAHVGTKPGKIIEEETGTQMGMHEGFWFYTVGQRQGLKLAGGPWYVVRKDTITNTVFISKNYYDEDKTRDSFLMTDVQGDLLQYVGKQLDVKLRHGALMHKATFALTDDQNMLRVTLSERDQGIAAGQFAVFYDGRVCVGSGMIWKGL